MQRRHLGRFAAVIAGMTLVAAGIGTGLRPLVGYGSILSGMSLAFGLAHFRPAVRLEFLFWWSVVFLWTLGGVLHGFTR